MKLRLTGVAVVVAALGCRRQRLRQVLDQQHPLAQGLQDGNNLYKKAEYKAAIERYEASSSSTPTWASPTSSSATATTTSTSRPRRVSRKRRQPHEGGRELPDGHREAGQQRPSRRSRRSGSLAFEYLIAVYGAEKLNDFCKAEPIAKELIAAEPTSPPTTRRSAGLYEDRGRYDEAEASSRRPSSCGRRTASATSCSPASTTARATSRRPWRLHTSAPPRSRTTPKPGTPSAASTGQGLPGQEAAAKVGARVHVKGLEAEDKALALNPEYFEALELQEHPAPAAGALREGPGSSEATDQRGRGLLPARRSRCRRSRTRAPRPPPPPQQPARRATSRRARIRRQGAAGERWPRLFSRALAARASP